MGARQNLVLTYNFIYTTTFCLHLYLDFNGLHLNLYKLDAKKFVFKFFFSAAAIRKRQNFNNMYQSQ